MTAAAMAGRLIIDRQHRFFVVSAIIMGLIVFSGFATSLALGRSSFAVPVFLHIHAFFFFGWTVLYLAQNMLVGSDLVALHRRLGWLAVGWIPAMTIMGTFVTVVAVRERHSPFFFQPAYFVVMNLFLIYSFAALAVAAIVLRRRTRWHRVLMFCAMATLLAPAIGRIIPSPLFAPFTSEVTTAFVALFPIAGMIYDRRPGERIHPAWRWGLGTILATQLAIDVIGYSPLAPIIYAGVTAGSPGAIAPPMAFPPPPWAKRATPGS